MLHPCSHVFNHPAPGRASTERVMMNAWALLGALALVACDSAAAPQQVQPRARTADSWCQDYYATVNLSDYVDQRTGRLSRDPRTDEIYYPGTNRVAVTREQAACIRREAQRAIDAYEGK